MPTYDYKCLECGDTFEHFQSIKDEPLQTCEECGGNLKRLIGMGVTPIFKGSGFYETDYKKNKKIENKTSKKSAESKGKSDKLKKTA